MIKSIFRIKLLFLCFFLAACQSINHSRAELNIPPSAVIFSFDDGPNAHGDTTARLLDVLKKYQIYALFSLLGENVEHNPELVRRINNEGHFIVNHGYSDKWASRMNDDEFRDNLARGEAAITAALGHELYPKLYRPHGGFYTTGQEQIFREAGYTLVASNIRAHDAVVDRTKQRKIVKQIITKATRQNGGIILLHDERDSHFRMEKELAKKPQGVFNRSWIPETVEEIIIALLGKGFIVVSPDILFTMQIH
ncbi:MAG: polysaccharide deacetylase family protein [Treponema sp.]|jgi:peptidoglycan/xylan/chitin deacetylase (PgdA/CDA1 family)|nr:polysaccharide deacetylase family protein [Treponema sp.]